MSFGMVIAFKAQTDLHTRDATETEVSAIYAGSRRVSTMCAGPEKPGCHRYLGFSGVTTAAFAAQSSMKSTRDHLTAEEVAAYASRWLHFDAEYDIENHAAVCEQCFNAIMDSLWDSLEAASADASAPASKPVLVRAW
jgi:hypothetical protein